MSDNIIVLPTDSIEQLEPTARAAVQSAHTEAVLDEIKARFLGKTGVLTQHLRSLQSLSVDEKKSRGATLNQVKQAVEKIFNERRTQIIEEQTVQRLRAEALDVTLPGRGQSVGGLHPLTLVQERIERIFHSLGFVVAEGPEIETDWYNFTALNNPEDHPARSMQDTFYLETKDEQGRPLVLRTHTSPMQLRYARYQVAHNKSVGNPSSMPPIRVIAPGRTYRVDSDATHSPMFHQVEGLWIDTDVSFADLKGVYTDFLRCFFETNDLQLRFRPSFFPFTEPSVEIDLQFTTGPRRGRWLEISGAGQVHPLVVQNFGLDPETYIGFAFGSGIERLAMLYYGIDDLRLFFEGDVRFLRSFQG